MTSILRNNLLFRFASVCAAVVWLSAGAVANEQPDSHSTVMGEVRLDGVPSWGELTVEVAPITGGGLMIRSQVRDHIQYPVSPCIED